MLKTSRTIIKLFLAKQTVQDYNFARAKASCASRMSGKKRPSDSNIESEASKKPKPFWSLGLSHTLKDPSTHVQSDSQVIVIKDMYPKARFHYLVMPKEDISSLRSVTKDNLELLKHMERVGKELSSKHKGSQFKIGYHAEPSMSKLHLQVISDDMQSDCLKTKKHWNSFTTDFFLKSEEICKQLEDEGRIEFLSKATCNELINSPLKCHKCDYTPKNIPDLKRHIVKHQ